MIRLRVRVNSSY